VFEHRKSPLLPRRAFYARLSWSIGAALLVLSGALFVGMLGYHLLERMPWIDAFMNAAMILSGMGPATPLSSDAAKLFAGLYALFSGLAFIAGMGIIFAPVYHRFLHRFHLEMSDEDSRHKRR
jgi:hypothetical protein